MQQKRIEGFRLSPQQKHLWPLSHFYTCSTQASFLLQGNLNKTRLYAAIQAIIERHEILRTAFQQLSGMTFPVQVVNSDNHFSYQEVDLSGLSLDEQRFGLNALFQEEKLHPFHFEKGPIFRCALIKLSTSERIFCINLPSICADASTLRNLMQEISRIYASPGQAQNQADDPLQYTQGSEWLNELLEDEEAETARDYWLKQIPPTLFALTLPLQQHSSSHIPAPVHLATIPVPLRADLRAQLYAYNHSPALFLQTCWHAFLGRISEHTDIVVGTAFDGRKFAELQHALGPYTTYLPVRVQVVPTVPFNALLDQVAHAVDQASTLQEYFTWEYIGPSLGIDSDHSYFPICFEFDAWPSPTQAADVRFSLLERDCSSEQCYLKLSCLQVGEQISAQISYRSDLFTSDLITWLAERLETFICDALQRPDTAVQALQIVGPLERQHLLYELNSTTADFPAAHSIHQLFAKQAHATPDQIALSCQEHQLTYQELNHRGNQLCHWLQRCGVRPGVFVGLFLERSVESLIALLGVLKTGGAYVPLDPVNPQPRLLQQLEADRLAVLLTQEYLLEKVEIFQGAVLCLDRDQYLLAQEATADPDDELLPEQIAYVISTSGSTGNPKGVVITHRNLSNYTHFLLRTLNARSRLSFASVSTVAADLGNTAIFPALLSGGCLHLVSYEVATDGATFAHYMTEHAIDVLKIVPSHLRALMAAQEDQESRRDVLPVRYLICGGEKFPKDLLTHIRATGATCQVINHYGPTETTVGALLYLVATNDDAPWSSTVPIGRPIANTDIYLLDEQLQPVPLGVPGELYIGGSGIAQGYLHEPEQTAQQFIPHPFAHQVGSRLYRTGDRVRYLPDNCVEFLGRFDRQVKIRGFRVELGEIETVLRQHPAIRDAVVSLHHTETSDLNRLVAYIVPRYDVNHAELRLHQLPNTMSVFHLNKNETEHLYREIFKNKVHLQHGIRLRDGDCILDVGANIGFFTLFAHQQCSAPRIYAFEPNPVAFEQMRLNIERYGLDVHLFNCGLSDVSKLATLSFYPRASVMSGFYADTNEEQEIFKSVIYNELHIEEEGLEGKKDGIVDKLLEGRFEQKNFLCKLKTLSDVINEQHLTCIDLLKLDVEKSELDVLNGIKREDWLKIKQIVAEVHDVEGRVTHITALLEGHGFTVAVEQTAVLRGTNIYKVYAVRREMDEEQDLKVTTVSSRPLSVVNDILFSALDVRRYMRERLPEYMVPTTFVPLTTLPLTANGKVDYSMLLIPEQTFSSLEAQFVAPRTPLEAALADIWKQILGIEQVGIYDNFFEIGGDSILSLQIVTLARQQGLKLTTKQIFKHQNIAALATIVGISSPSWKEQDSITGPIPLIPIQHWFFEQRIPDRHHWNMALLLETQRNFQPALADRAIQYLLAHHDALRIRFRADETGYQQIDSPIEEKAPFTQIDLSRLSIEEQEVTIEALLTEFNRSLNLADGPLFRVACINSGMQRVDQLLIVIHHLIVDGISMRILLEDLQILYQQLERGEVMQLPLKTNSFRLWARQLVEYAQSATLQQELPYWMEMFPSVVPHLPIDKPLIGKGLNKEAFIRSVSVALDPQETKNLLQEVPKAYHTQINDALLAALAWAMAAWTGERFFLVDLEGHGREELFEGVDLSRTVGWFTTQFPVLLTLDEPSTLGDALKTIKEQLRAVPNHGIGYGLLRYLRADGKASEQLRALPQSEVRFNYLGQFDQAFSKSALFRPTDKPCGSLYCLQGERQYLLDITGSIIEGQLKVDFDYSEKVYNRDTVEKLAANFIRALRELIAWCQLAEEPGFTPSDFPEAGLNQEELENFLKNWTEK